MFVEKPRNATVVVNLGPRQALEELMEGMAPPRRCLDINGWPSVTIGGDMGRNPAILSGMNSKCFLPKNWLMSQKLGISCQLFRGINGITFVEVKWLKCNLSVHSDLVFVIHLWWIVRVSAWLDLGICLVEIGNYIRSITHMSAWVTVFVCYLRYAFSWIRHASVLLDII